VLIEYTIKTLSAEGAGAAFPSKKFLRKFDKIWKNLVKFEQN